MDNRFRWITILAAVLLAVTVGIVAYNMGVSHGQAIASTAAGATPPSVQPYYWYRPWGFGFGFGPVLFLLFWFFLFRIIFWGGYRRYRWSYPGSWNSSPSFDEWHRRAHERMDSKLQA
jgi:hypothetical protein